MKLLYLLAAADFVQLLRMESGVRQLECLETAGSTYPVGGYEEEAIPTEKQ